MVSAHRAGVHTTRSRQLVKFIGALYSRLLLSAAQIEAGVRADPCTCTVPSAPQKSVIHLAHSVFLQVR